MFNVISNIASPVTHWLHLRNTDCVTKTDVISGATGVGLPSLRVSSDLSGVSGRGFICSPGLKISSLGLPTC